ncbi:hypothetical protein [Nostoc sp.]
MKLIIIENHILGSSRINYVSDRSSTVEIKCDRTPDYFMAYAQSS